LVVIHAGALATSESRTCAGVAVAWDERKRAAAPVTCGVAIEVPLRVAVPEFL
jgi:hypothetical protein